MSRTELEFLRAEIGTLKRFLSELTEDDVIERVQLEHRLGAARERLAEIETLPQRRPLSIAFRGEPVAGVRSIDATFATLAIKAFVEATDTVTASLIAGELKDRGPLPGVGDRSLRIVDTVAGSFGFELELPPPTDQQPTSGDSDDPHVEAITTTLALLDQAATDDDDAISDLVAKVHPRAAAKVRAFAKVLAEHRALFAVSFEGKQVHFDDEAQVRRVVDSLDDEDIGEEHEAHVGMLLGVLPQSRDFEARLEDGTTIRGKIDLAVQDIAGFKQQWENVKATLHFRVVRVRTNRRHVLAGISA